MAQGQGPRGGERQGPRDVDDHEPRGDPYLAQGQGPRGVVDKGTGRFWVDSYPILTSLKQPDQKLLYRARENKEK